MAVKDAIGTPLNPIVNHTVHVPLHNALNDLDLIVYYAVAENAFDSI